MPQLPAEDYYKILGVNPMATPKEIDDAYFEAIRRVHPDVATDGGKPPTAGELEFRTHLAAKINGAGTVLRNPVKRAAYDLDRRRAQERSRRAQNPMSARPANTPVARQGPPGAPRSPHSTGSPGSGSQSPYGAKTDPSGRPGGEPYYTYNYHEDDLDPRSPRAPANPYGEPHRTNPYSAADDPSFDDFLVKKRNPAGPPKSVVQWFWRYKGGQWLLTIGLFALLFLASQKLIDLSLISQADLYFFALRATGLFMLAMALFQRSLANPAGDVFHLAMDLADKVIDLGDTSRSRR